MSLQTKFHLTCELFDRFLLSFGHSPISNQFYEKYKQKLEKHFKDGVHWGKVR